MEFYILAISKVISGWVPYCDSAHLWQLYSAATLGILVMTPSLALSWHWANQYLPSPNNAERLALKRELSIFKVTDLICHGYEPMRFENADLPKRETALNSFSRDPVWSIAESGIKSYSGGPCWEMLLTHFPLCKHTKCQLQSFINNPRTGDQGQAYQGICLLECQDRRWTPRVGAALIGC